MLSRIHFPGTPKRSGRSGPVLTPTQRPGLIAALERALQRAQLRLGVPMH